LLYYYVGSNIVYNNICFIAVASSGIASQLIPGGRTAHSRFCIPFVCDEESTCNIMQGCSLAELIENAKLIIWDEAPMCNRYCIEAVDRTLRDIMRFKNPNSEDQPFGGKIVVFGGDFRQILPVIPKGSRQDIVMASLTSSYLWSSCKVFSLSKNMRLNQAVSPSEAQLVREFSEWILAVGNGKIGQEVEDGLYRIKIPHDLLISDFTDPIAGISDAIYPDISSSAKDAAYFSDRAILAPTLDEVDGVNQYLLDQVQGDEKVYLSSDSICNDSKAYDESAETYTTEFLNSIKGSGLPSHKICLKVGVPIMLLRNIDRSLGLCNGTRLIVSRLSDHVIEGIIMSGRNAGEKVCIARMTIIPSDLKLPFRIQRRQFPITISFAMTINKSQGQSLSFVGIFLRRPVFTHGQLYVALSRVRSRSGLKILIDHNLEFGKGITFNCVYKEVFQVDK